MHIRAAGSVFSVGKRSVHTSVSDLMTVAEDIILTKNSNENLKMSEKEMHLNSENCNEKYKTKCTDEYTCELSSSTALLHENNQFSICDEKNTETNSENIFLNKNPAEFNENIECQNTLLDVMSDGDFVIPPPAEYASSNFTPIRKSKSAPPPLSTVRNDCGNLFRGESRIKFN